MTEQNTLDLQLFAGEAAEGAIGETGDDTTADAGQLTDPEAETAFSGDDGDEAFSALISGKYREPFQKRTQAIIDKRFRETKELEKYRDTVSPLLSKLCEKYGIEDADPASLSAKLETQELQSENDELRAKEEGRERVRALFEEGEELQKLYPDFDLCTEVENSRDFAKLIQNGVPLKTAYEVVHNDEILGSAMSITAQKVREQVVKGIEAKGRRPLENGIISESGIVTKTDVGALTSTDILKILKQVENGANIKF